MDGVVSGSFFCFVASVCLIRYTRAARVLRERCGLLMQSVILPTLHENGMAHPEATLESWRPEMVGACVRVCVRASVCVCVCVPVCA